MGGPVGQQQFHRLMADTATPEAVRYLMGLQELVRAPQRLPVDTAITPGGSTMPTVTFAAADSLLMDQIKADYVCPGTFDPGASDGQFMQGQIDAAAVTGLSNGRVVLLSGHYSMEVLGSVGYALKLPPSWGIEGQTGYGPFNMGPILEGYTQTGTPGAADTVLLLDDLALVRGINVNGSGEAVWAIRSPASSDSVVITDCYIDNSLGLYCAGQDVWVQRNRFADGQDRDITFDSVLRGWITDNRTGNCQGHSIAAVNGGGLLTIRDNTLVAAGEHAIYIDNAAGVSISHNFIPQAGFAVAGGSGIVVENLAEHVSIVGNEVELPNEDGIRLTDLDEALVFGNRLLDYTGAGIILDGDANKNYVLANILRSSQSPTYGIRVNAGTCDGNIVIGNDLRGAGGTEFSNAGTGTLTTWPAGAAGANFV